MIEPLTCAVMLTTRNRREDLARTCEALALLQPAPQEVIVCADGCTDGSVEMLRERWPHFRLVIHEPARGSIASRDEMMRASTADLVLSLDDDSYPLDADFLARAQALFAAQPRLAVADFPQQSDEPSQQFAVKVEEARACGSYSSASAVIRRAAFLEVGGYPGFFFHAYEEPDFALRCVAAGYEVQLQPGSLIRHHYTGVQRNEVRTHHFHARNEVWSVLLRCPWPWLPLVALFRAARQFGYALSRGAGWVVREPAWWWQCVREVPRCFRERRALPWTSYRAWWRRLRG